MLVFVRHKQSNNSDKQSAHASKSGRTSAAHTASSEDGNDWIEKVNQTVSNVDNQDWEWGGSGSNDATASVSAQEVDPLTEYQVYKQFGYESKAAESLAGYLNTLEDGAPEKLVHELIGLNLRVGNIDMLADTLERHSASLSEDSVAEYLKAGLALDSTNLRLRVLPSIILVGICRKWTVKLANKAVWKLLPTSILPLRTTRLSALSFQAWANVRLSY